MHDLLLERPPFYVSGLLIGFAVVALLALVNRRLGVTGGVSAFVERATGRTGELGWRGAFLIGVVGGGLLFALLAGTFARGGGYGWLSRELGGGAEWLIGPILVASGVLVGFGAKQAGGCTSGNGLSGSSFGSPASFAATATFMGTAVLATMAMDSIF
jgi:uncharacterized membrane protein YedE/YeeE